MRILLDECVPRRLRGALVGHEVTTVPQAGWAGKKNGELLALIEGAYDAFLTVDRAIPSQQRLVNRPYAVLILHAESNRLADLLPLDPDVLAALEVAQAGEVRHIRG